MLPELQLAQGTAPVLGKKMRKQLRASGFHQVKLCWSHVFNELCHFSRGARENRAGDSAEGQAQHPCLQGGHLLLPLSRGSGQSHRVAVTLVSQGSGTQWDSAEGAGVHTRRPFQR